MRWAGIGAVAGVAASSGAAGVVADVIASIAASAAGVAAALFSSTGASNGVGVQGVRNILILALILVLTTRRLIGRTFKCVNTVSGTPRPAMLMPIGIPRRGVYRGDLIPRIAASSASSTRPMLSRSMFFCAMPSPLSIVPQPPAPSPFSFDNHTNNASPDATMMRAPAATITSR